MCDLVPDPSLFMCMPLPCLCPIYLGITICDFLLILRFFTDLELNYLPLLFSFSYFLYNFFQTFLTIICTLQIVFSLLFSLVIAFMSDALNAVSDKASVLSRDTSFRREFQERVSCTNFGLQLSLHFFFP